MKSSLNEKIKPVFTVKTKEDLKRALTMANIGFFDDFTVRIKEAVKCLGPDYCGQIEECLDMSEMIGGFSVSQQRVFPWRYYLEPGSGAAVIECRREYHFDVREKNRLHDALNAIASEIAVFRQNDIKDLSDINLMKSWFKNNIEYMDTDSPEDFSALSAVKNGHGVCQAISAIACRVFELLGYPSIYVEGKYGSGDEPGSHCWNLIKRDGVWRHYDFTHSLSTKGVPGTDRQNSTVPFRKNRSWDKSIYTPEACDEYIGRLKVIRDAGALLFADKNHMFSGDIMIETNRPVLKTTEEGPALDIDFLCSIWGGGCLYDEKEDLLKGYTFDWQDFYLQPDEDHEVKLRKDGYAGKDIIERLPFDIDARGGLMTVFF